MDCGDLTPPRTPRAGADAPASPARAASLLSKTLSRGLAAGAAAADAAAAYSAAYLPTQLSGSLSARRCGAEPPAVDVAVRAPRRGAAPARAELLRVPLDTPLRELAAQVAGLTGAPPGRQRLLIEEAEAADGEAGGVRAALRAAAARLSRGSLRAAAVEYANFLFLPEAVNREVRGRGLAAWYREHLRPRLAGPPPLGRAAATVALLGGRRVFLDLDARRPLAALREAAARAAGLPLARQRLVVVAAPAPGAAAALLWAFLRLVYAICCAAAGAAGGAARWVLLGPDADACGADERITLRLQGGGAPRGEELALRPDLTLGELQAMVAARSGDALDLSALVLAPRSARGAV
jgi:hypothetical protein